MTLEGYKVPHPWPERKLKCAGMWRLPGKIILSI